ncbi:MAG: hypothetical protein AAF558_09350 [Verrucomicrobiota bacterium]
MSVVSLSRWIRHRFSSPAQREPTSFSPSELLRDQRLIFTRSQMLVYAIYAFQLFIALSLLPQWEGYLNRPNLLPLWPILWVQWLPCNTGVFIILVLFLTGSFTGAFFARWRSARLLAFIGIFFFTAFNNSFGKIGHSLHVLTFISFILIFLPDGWHLARQPKRVIRQSTIFTLWCAQAIPLLAYTMAGLIKIICGVGQLVSGQASVFGWEGLPRHVADRLLQTNSEPFLGSIFIDYPWFSMPLMWITLYIEFFALWALFRPAIQWFFIGSLVAFHAASFFTMTIIFPHNCFLIVLLLAAAPLHNQTWTWASFARQLPLFGRLVRHLTAGT